MMDAESALVIWGVIVGVLGILLYSYILLDEIFTEGNWLLRGTFLLVIWVGVVIGGWYIATYQEPPCGTTEFNETEYVPVSCVVEWDSE